MAFCHTPNLVFDNRNKLYGAYILRKSYNDKIIIAMIATIIFAVTVLAGPVIYKYLVKEDVIEKKKEIKVAVKLAPPPPMDPKLPPPPPVPPPPPPPKISTVKFVPPEPEEDEKVQEEPPKIEDLKNKQISTETVKGDDNVNPDNVIVVDEPTNQAGSVIGAQPQEEEPFIVVEQMPEPPGGMAAFMKYLSKNINYPAQARRNGVEGKVFLSFVVAPDGSIKDITLLKGIGAGCDEEAIRVLSNSPKWTPGKQSGRAVPVKYTLPVVFKIQ
ncbi:MAG: TonB family protein [Microscillaceae bacterium]|nr:TonB family protein [Microscillaceae bacterium]MDW8460443.1 TonB family protein [Cytophagales bacterium]